MTDAEKYGRMVGEVTELRQQLVLTAEELVRAQEAWRIAEESLALVVRRLDGRGLANVLMYVAMRAGVQGRDYTAMEAAEALRAWVLDEQARDSHATGGASAVR